MTNKRFYVYLHRTDDGRPFYVGKGTCRKHGNKYSRAYDLKRTNYHKGITTKYGCNVEILREFDCEKACFRYEGFSIGRWGTFHEWGFGCNFTYGGEGVTGGSTNENSSKEDEDSRIAAIKEAMSNRTHTWSDKISKSLQNVKRQLPKPITTPEGEFQSLKRAARELNLSRPAIVHRINSTLPRWDKWKYIEVEEPTYIIPYAENRKETVKEPINWTVIFKDGEWF